ncbi:uncharacterized protein PAC_06131 [Phialocephala subalpina]|uniref:Uncharacterized protein n=1 Tax=Phialocephala subalpina TaxID=576137 RepID=A0A1L7WU08_9HELO|nr:uncharacterized protein PAC_06131 [Phialocephala subalpina]
MSLNSCYDPQSLFRALNHVSHDLEPQFWHFNVRSAQGYSNLTSLPLLPHTTHHSENELMLNTIGTGSGADFTESASECPGIRWGIKSLENISRKTEAKFEKFPSNKSRKSRLQCP